MITLILTLLVLGVVLYVIESMIPMPTPFKMLIRIVIVVFAILLILRAFGIADVPVRG